ncbi:MAG: PQQ-binding-like beta-propeller repeat protein [Dehalococcoidia bacterium]
MRRFPNRRLAAILALGFAPLALLSSACAAIASPDGWASPVVAGELLLISHDDELFAVDSSTFSARWAFPPDGEDIDPVALYGTPGASTDTVFIPTHKDTLYAINADDGQLAWPPFETDGSLIGGVVVSEDTLYFGSNDGRVYALDVASGSIRWAPFPTGEPVWSTPALANGMLLVTSLDGKLYVIDAADGRLAWTFDTGAGVASPPVVDEATGQVYLAGFDGKLRAVDLETHEENWSVSAGNWFWTEPLVSGGVVYAGSLDGKVYAVDAATGDLVWEPFDTGEPVRSAPVLAGESLIVVNRAGEVFGLDPETGVDAFGSPLLLSNDVLADPLAVEGEDGPLIIIVTTNGNLIQINPATLQLVTTRPLGG